MLAAEYSTFHSSINSTFSPYLEVEERSYLKKRHSKITRTKNHHQSYGTSLKGKLYQKRKIDFHGHVLVSYWLTYFTPLFSVSYNHSTFISTTSQQLNNNNDFLCFARRNSVVFGLWSRFSTGDCERFGTRNDYEYPGNSPSSVELVAGSATIFSK